MLDPSLVAHFERQAEMLANRVKKRFNGIGAAHNQLVPSGTRAFLESAVSEGRRFDLAVVDPPSYSTSREGQRDFDILRDHPALLAAVIAVMRRRAILPTAGHFGLKRRLAAAC